MEGHKDARRAARTTQQVNEPNVENLTWPDFEVLFENQYFPESYREQLRDQLEKLEQGTLTVSEYATRFQSLSHFALEELVATEDGKCRRFEKGLHSSVKRLVLSNHIGKYSEIVECVRNLKLPRDATRNVKVWEPRQPTVSVNSFLGSFGSQGRKRQRQLFQSSQSRQTFKAPISSGVRGKFE